MTWMLKLVPVFAAAALLFAVYLAMKVSRQEAGTRRMKEISDAIADGARAFLMAEYRILVVFVVVLFVLIGVGTRSLVTAVCFVAGALFSTLAGYFGMQVATRANVRTANAAMKSGMNLALSIAFSGGAVMGLCVAGLGVLGVSLIYLITGDIDVLSRIQLRSFLHCALCPCGRRNLHEGGGRRSGSGRQGGGRHSGRRSEKPGRHCG